MTSLLLTRPTLHAATPLPRSDELIECSWLKVGEQLAPGVWVVPVRQWVSASELDRFHNMPTSIEDRAADPVDTWDDPREWVKLAACQGMDLATFFGDDPSAHRPALRRSVLRLARLVCDSCPVVRECLTWALVHDERGIWGATSRRQRRAWLQAVGRGETTVDEVVAFCHPAK